MSRTLLLFLLVGTGSCFQYLDASGKPTAQFLALCKANSAAVKALAVSQLTCPTKKGPMKTAVCNLINGITFSGLVGVITFAQKDTASPIVIGGHTKLSGSNMQLVVYGATSCPQPEAYTSTSIIKTLGSAPGGEWFRIEDQGTLGSYVGQVAMVVANGKPLGCNKIFASTAFP